LPAPWPGQGPHKGIFITTSDFTEDARAFISKVNSTIVLIDGEELANLMLDHGTGVTTTMSYEVKRIDSDCFTEDD
jgi:restriction system protein